MIEKRDRERKRERESDRERRRERKKGREREREREGERGESRRGGMVKHGMKLVFSWSFMSTHGLPTGFAGFPRDFAGFKDISRNFVVSHSFCWVLVAAQTFSWRCFTERDSCSIG